MTRRKPKDPHDLVQVVAYVYGERAALAMLEEYRLEKAYPVPKGLSRDDVKRFRANALLADAWGAGTAAKVSESTAYEQVRRAFGDDAVTALKVHVAARKSAQAAAKAAAKVALLAARIDAGRKPVPQPKPQRPKARWTIHRPDPWELP